MTPTLGTDKNFKDYLSYRKAIEDFCSYFDKLTHAYKNEDWNSLAIGWMAAKGVPSKIYDDYDMKVALNDLNKEAALKRLEELNVCN